MTEEAIEPSDEIGYVVPNEAHPYDGMPIFQNNNGGAYISVGTERGFIGAALSKSNRLILIDISPSVVRFNRINCAILKLAQDRQDYFKLRTEPEALSQQVATLATNHPIRVTLEQNGNLKWWSVAVSHNEHFDSLQFPNKSIEKALQQIPTGLNVSELIPLLIPFRNANYLYEDSLFQAVHSLAKQDRIESHLMNLLEMSSAEKLSSALQKEHEKIGILDISNVWDGAFLGVEGVVRLVENLKTEMASNSILLQTGQGGGKSGWSFNGLTYQFLLENGGTAEVVLALYRAVVNALDVESTFNGKVTGVIDEQLRPLLTYIQTSTSLCTDLLASLKKDPHSSDKSGKDEEKK